LGRGGGGVGSNNPLIQVQNGTSTLGYGKGGTGYGSGGGGTSGRNPIDSPSAGGDGFSGIIVIKLIYN